MVGVNTVADERLSGYATELGFPMLDAGPSIQWLNRMNKQKLNFSHAPNRMVNALAKEGLHAHHDDKFPVTDNSRVVYGASRSRRSGVFADLVMYRSSLGA